MIEIFLFYDKANGVQEKFTFSKDFKHCNLLTCDGEYSFLTWLDGTGINRREVKYGHKVKFMNRIKKNPDLSAMIVVWVEDRVEKKWFPFMLRSCNEVCRLSSSVDIGVTLNSAHLHHKLLRLNGQRNFTIDYAWRRK
jgi:hypothetical protein